MDTKTLEAFLALANHLNFTKSAEQLYISQPAFSRQIIKLEDEYGCELFFRNKRHVELTEYGHAYLGYAQHIYSEHEKWLLHLKHMKSCKAGHLRIGFLQDLPHDFFPELIRTFSCCHPDIELNLSDCGMVGVIDGILRGDLDCGFSLSSNIKEYEDISCLAVASMTMCAAFPVDHPMAERASIRMEELAAEPFVMVSPDLSTPGSQHVNYLCKIAGFEPNIAAFSSFVPSLLTLVKCGVGIAIVAQAAQNASPSGIRFVPLEDECALIEPQLLWKTNSRNPSLPAFLETAKKLLVTPI